MRYGFKNGELAVQVEADSPTTAAEQLKAGYYFGVVGGIDNDIVGTLDNDAWQRDTSNDAETPAEGAPAGADTNEQSEAEQQLNQA